jgi:3-methylcrotonyl-CoA carboxylase alpha subunit
MFNKILIANRGEIAVRIIKACREMGIRTVAVYSEADFSASHVRLADEAWLIGPAPVTDSYLCIDKILDVARQTQVDAIHPGYGLLSENSRFANDAIEAGFVFIGPSPKAIEIMGDKSAARILADRIGVSVVPGYDGDSQTNNFLVQKAGELGFPVLIKAAAGGGGKGMRVCWNKSSFSDLADAARREAVHSFGNDRLVIEKFIPKAHHIEFQIIGDQYGHTIHLFERDCSVQRRHQKIIEESPSPLLNKDLRSKMGAEAVKIASSVGYYNLGTVEFLFDPESQQYYFLEMNTRLQVEHPVTELVTGLDLVKWQIRIASGEPLPLSPDSITQRGHAIECRLYAEDPENRFLPASGKILRFDEPAGPGIRVDSGIKSGDEITFYYDPLIAKIIVLDDDRKAAITKMINTLSDTVLLGLTSNLDFLKEVLAHKEFGAGAVHTTWVEENFSDWTRPHCEILPEILIAAALSEWNTGDSHRTGVNGQEALQTDNYSPWKRSAGYRMFRGGK